MRDDASSGEIVSLYLTECDQMLRKFEKIVMDSDQAGYLTDVGELFRIAHTLKGSSAMMEYAPLVDASHGFEDILAAVKRAEHAPDAAQTRAVADVGMEFTAYFQAELAQIRAGGAPRGDEKLRKGIDELAGRMGVRAPKAASVSPTPAPAAPARADVCRVRMRLKSCPMPHIRAFLVARAASALCAFVETVPDALDKAAAFDEAIQNEGCEIRFTPKPPATAEDVIRKIAAQPYVVSCVAVAAPIETEPAQNVTVAQSLVNELIGRIDEIASAESALEACLDAAGARSGRASGLLAALRRGVADAGILASAMGMHDVEGVFLQMRRAVRGMAKDMGKEIRVVTVGADVRVDKSVLDILSDSLIHIVRNAADHGIEPPEEREARGKAPFGTITLAAVKRNDYLIVTVSDDGAGIRREAVLNKAARMGRLTKESALYTDAEAYALLLTGGVSTSAEVTRYSGRGVGLDAVVRRVKRAGGDVSVDGAEGAGTTFCLKIPVSLMVTDGIEVSLDGGDLVVPANAIYHIARDGASGAASYRGEEYAPLAFPGGKKTEGEYAILLARDYGRYCIRARNVRMMTTYYVKPMPDYVADALGGDYIYSGCVLGADAGLLCVLDAEKLARQKG